MTAECPTAGLGVEIVGGLTRRARFAEGRANFPTNCSAARKELSVAAAIDATTKPG